MEKQISDDKVKLFLQSSNGGGKVSLKARKTSTVMALIHFFLKKMGEDMTDAAIKKKGIRLQFDGESLDYDEKVGEIEDGGLEGDECLDVVGL